MSRDQKRDAKLRDLYVTHASILMRQGVVVLTRCFIKAFSNRLVSDWNTLTVAAVSALKGRTTTHTSEAVNILKTRAVGETEDYTGRPSKAAISTQLRLESKVSLINLQCRTHDEKLI